MSLFWNTGIKFTGGTPGAADFHRSVELPEIRTSRPAQYELIISWWRPVKLLDQS